MEEERTDEMEMAEKEAEERKEAKTAEEVSVSSETFKYEIHCGLYVGTMGVFDNNITSFCSS